MLLLTILTLALLAFVNFRIGGKALFYPPVVFCSVWAADLILAWVAGDFFYPLSSETLLIFSCGCVVFSLGSWLTLFFPWRKPTENHRRSIPISSNRIISILFLLVIGGAPFYYHWISGLISSADVGTSFLLAARIATLDEANLGTSYSIFMNLATLSVIVAMIAFYEKESHPRRAVVSVALAIAMNILLGAKSGVISLVLALICIDWIKTRRIRRKFFLGMFLVFALGFVTVELYVHPSGTGSDASLRENIAPVFRTFVLYAAGGIVAFDRVVREPNVVPHNWHIYGALLSVLNHLGARFGVPGQNEFVAVGPSSTVINVYTIYFAYLDFGFIGMMALTGMLGLIVTLIYSKIFRGGSISRLVYASVFPGLLLSPFAEYFFMSLNFLLKFYAVTWLVYSSPAIWAKFDRHMKIAVQEQLSSRGSQ